ncbi:VOC family protein [Streptomyces coffeae]|uniref:VOC family protein n=1 Tax=Streptomyces coffeae TaxID=621382 RepID=A0ABS1NEW0_9ACTN|nr:VOC family protein [Streptomyces coffeae]MBL1098631.1 VOC family protein [Streptomyces coffeae]
MTAGGHERPCTPCWVSLTTPSLRETRDFYSAVLGWTWRPGEAAEGLLIALSGGDPMASIGEPGSGLRAAAHWTPFFATSSADDIAARIRERGGTVGVGPLSFGTGRIALASDAHGAVFGFWEGAVFPGWPRDQASAPAWLELRTRDTFAAAVFYGEIFGWTTEDSACTVEYEDGEVVVREAGRRAVAIRGGAVETAPDPQVRPRWCVHFHVADVDAAVTAARAAGGSVDVAPSASPSGTRREAALRDSVGGWFSVTTG